MSTRARVLAVVERAALAVAIALIVALTAVAGLLAVRSGAWTVDEDRSDAADPYHAAAARALLPPDGCLLQLVALPSFEAESAVCVTRNANGEYRVISTEMEQMLWGEIYERLEAKAGPSIATEGIGGPEAEAEVLREFTPRVRSVSAPIAAEPAQALAALWTAALRHEHERPLGCDGTTYYFAAGTKGPELGRFLAWSPEPVTRQGALVRIGARLAAYAEAPPAEREALAAALAEDARELRWRF